MHPSITRPKTKQAEGSERTGRGKGEKERRSRKERRK